MKRLLKVPFCSVLDAHEGESAQYPTPSEDDFYGLVDNDECPCVKSNQVRRSGSVQKCLQDETMTEG